MRSDLPGAAFAALLAFACSVAAQGAPQQSAGAALPPLPPPMGVPAPGPMTDAPYAPLAPRAWRRSGHAAFRPDRPILNKDRIREPEVYNMNAGSARPHQQHRAHSQPFHRSAHGGSRHQYRRRGHPGGGRRPQYAERRRRGHRFCLLLLQLRRQHGHPAQPPAQRRL